jgi:hypothetical protein
MMNPYKFGTAILTAAHASSATASPIFSTTATTTYHRTQVDGVGIFYREAGPRGAPAIVLLHGFPSSSRGYNMLIEVVPVVWTVRRPG